MDLPQRLARLVVYGLLFLPSRPGVQGRGNGLDNSFQELHVPFFVVRLLVSNLDEPKHFSSVENG